MLLYPLYRLAFSRLFIYLFKYICADYNGWFATFSPRLHHVFQRNQSFPLFIYPLCDVGGIVETVWSNATERDSFCRNASVTSFVCCDFYKFVAIYIYIYIPFEICVYFFLSNTFCSTSLVSSTCFIWSDDSDTSHSTRREAAVLKLISSHLFQHQTNTHVQDGGERRIMVVVVVALVILRSSLCDSDVCMHAV
uniref:Uncharacterized protein TCIL3000_5_2360 n=1 Tax=Trypanosoma congolense (strain IL3000) TaxID=1068625 RepID=G0UMW8_TRYCI|nr:unnamed protein product [Trypanosoma congolense IL3000]